MKQIGIQEGLVTITPAEVLAADVLVWVLWLLLDGDVMGDVLPVLSPEVVGIDGRDDQGGDDNAVEGTRLFVNTEVKI